MASEIIPEPHNRRLTDGWAAVWFFKVSRKVQKLLVIRESSIAFHAFASLRAAFPDTFSDNLRGNGGGGDGRHKSSAGIYAFLLRREGGRRI